MSYDQKTVDEYETRQAVKPKPEPEKSWVEKHWDGWWAKRLSRPAPLPPRRYRNKEDQAAAEAHEVAHRKQLHNVAHKAIAKKRAAQRRARRSAQRANRLH